MTEDIQTRVQRWLQGYEGWADRQELLDLAEPLIRDLLAAVEARQWQPIETAPKDGTPVLVYDANWCGNMGPRVTPAGWAPYTDGGGYWPGVTEPTHWQPLPAPPEAAR